MKAFVTGGTGFIGKRLVHKLVERGYDVYALARSEQGVAEMEAAGAQPVVGDITEVESMRPAMTGSDVVFHVAAWYKLGAPDWPQAEQINVQGTRNVLGLAYELGVPRIVYTSTVAVFGDTHGVLADESFYKPGEPFLTEYDRTKWKAHYEVAVPLIKQGAPVIIVQPGIVYGPGDHSLVGELMLRLYKGQLPIFPAPEEMLTFAHVDDIADGHILAAEKGKPGESYIITGPAMKLGEMAKLWAGILGRPAPWFGIPPQLIKPFAPLFGVINRIIPLPELFSQEAAMTIDATYLGRADKAMAELGWRPRPLIDGMRETFDWIAQTTRPPAPVSIRKRQAAALALGAALGVVVVWIARRRKKARD
jgi:nucleoside-diphosphate-sugar epimerase